MPVSGLNPVWRLYPNSIAFSKAPVSTATCDPSANQPTGPGTILAILKTPPFQSPVENLCAASSADIPAPKTGIPLAIVFNVLLLVATFVAYFFKSFWVLGLSRSKLTRAPPIFSAFFPNPFIDFAPPSITFNMSSVLWNVSGCIARLLEVLLPKKFFQPNFPAVLGTILIVPPLPA